MGTLHRNTIHACPKYCVTGNNICNGNGICGHSDQPCLCYEGYIGKHCETPGYAPSTSPEGFTSPQGCSPPAYSCSRVSWPSCCTCGSNSAAWRPWTRRPTPRSQASSTSSAKSHNRPRGRPASDISTIRVRSYHRHIL